MFRSDMHGRWDDDGDALRREVCAEMLGHFMAGGGGIPPYPYADMLYLLDRAETPGDRPGPAAGPLGRLARALTRKRERPRMDPTSAEGSGSGGRSASEQLPLRGVPA